MGEDEAVILAQVNEAITRAREKNPGLKARCYLAAGEEKCWTGDTISAKRYFPAWAVDEHSELVTKARRGLLAAGIDAFLVLHQRQPLLRGSWHSDHRLRAVT